jgi:CRP-like cAMP-binding protein
MGIHLFDRDPDIRSVPAGTVVFTAGDAGDVMYAVVEGEVDLEIRGQLVETVGRGGVFGEMALIEDQPRLATARVRTDARLVAIDRRRFEFLVQQSPFFALQLMGIVVGRLRRMDERL